MNSESSALRVMYFGMGGAFSVPPLAALLAAGVTVAAIVVPGLRTLPAGAGREARRALQRREWLPVSQPHGIPLQRLDAAPGSSILTIAADRRIPVLDVVDLAAAEVRDAVAAYTPDAICVACFPWKLPASVLGVPRLGCLNTHPSLLPENRGPDPLFWTFRHGAAYTGVTIHRMDAGLDTGPVLAQQRVPVPDGATEQALEAQLATLGADLLVYALHGLAAGILTGTAQDAARATAYPAPGPADYALDLGRSARWADNFIRGVGRRETPISLVLGAQQYRVRAAVACEPAGQLGQPWRRAGDDLWVQCHPGTLHVRVAPVSPGA